MGVVYRAIDVHLDRAVAIKVLRPDAVADPERTRRFVREARAASALNHPNIVTIYDIDRSNGVDFIAMEYVPGQALDRLIERGRPAQKDVLRYAIQAADALAKAHGAGIIHRDLKPANIIVTPDGSVKLLDFGVAKLVETASDDAQPTTLQSSPLTQEGAIVGTIAYMSPEQAEGKPIDARSDIFSFGTILYEMVTGHRPFSGDTKLATLTAILHEEPKPITETLKTAPREIERIIFRCLRKDPNRRFQHIGDVKVALEDLKEEADSGKTEAPTVASVRGSRRLAPLIVFGLLAIILAFWLGGRERAAPGALVLKRLTSDSGLTTEPALSPDGKLVAYASDRGGEGNLNIWVQQIPRAEARQLTSDSADDYDPDFSPDGQRIAFRSDRGGGGIHVVSALGGTEILIAPRGQGPRFSPDGNKIAYWVGSRGGYTASEIYTMDANGGPPQRVEVGVAFAQAPVWSPDGKHLLFAGALHATTANLEDWDWWVYRLDGGQLFRTGVRPLLQQRGITGFRQPDAWLPGERVVFSATLGHGTNLWELSLSPSTWRVEGAPQRLTTGPGPELHPSALGNGRMAFANHVENLDVWWLPVEAGKVVGELQRATDDAAADSTATISADGSRLTFVSDRSGNGDIWMKDLASGKETAVTLTPFDELWAVSNREGTKLAYRLRSENGQVSTHVLSAGHPGVPHKVCDDCGGPNDFSPDERWLLFADRPADASAPNPIAILDLVSGKKSRLIEHPTHTLFSPRFSPDGRWVSFQEFTGLASRRIYAAPLRGNAAVPARDWVPITDGTGLDRDAAWAPDGNLLYFFSERDGFPCIWAQRLEPLTKRPVGDMVPVYHLHHARRSLRSLDNLGVARLSTAPGKLVFSMGEYTGNVWLASTMER